MGCEPRCICDGRRRVRPIASLSLDLDNKWSYMKTHGDAGWDDFPSYLDLVVPRTLEFFADRGQRITYFIVGQDAALEKNRSALSQIGRAGHEVGNHSFRHEPWLHLYSDEELEREIAQAEDAITDATGVRPSGFRGPGFSFTGATLQVLRRRRYLFDASTFPTYLGPLARAYYFMSSKLSESDREQRKQLFGSAKEGLRSVEPYLWDTMGGPLLEIPVTTFPWAKVPFHLSYVLYLSTFSEAVARTYFRSAIWACAKAGVAPSLLLHPLDFIGADEVQEVNFFPGMNIPTRAKLERVTSYLDIFCEHFDVRPVGEHARRILSETTLELLPLPDGVKE